MSLNGNLHTMALSDLLQWILFRTKTGVVDVKRRSTEKRLVFREGRLASARSNDPRETLGQFLIRDRLITEEQLFKALLRQEQDQQRPLLGAILVSEGVVTQEQLIHTLRACAEEAAYDLFLWPEGEFEFQEGESPQDVLGDLDLDTDLLIEEGNHRLGEWRKIKRRIPNASVRFQVEVGQKFEGVTERQIAGLATAGKTLAEISLETRRSVFETALVLDNLCEQGALKVSKVLASGGEADPVAAIRSLLQVADQRLRDGRLDAALEAYEDALALDGLNQEAKKGLVAVSNARRQQRTSRQVPGDKIPVLRQPAEVLAQEQLDAQEGFVLSRINGEWDVRSILKLCPMPEDDALAIFIRLLERKVILLR